MSIKQIAKMAGVSQSTVSRVLRDPEHKCADEEVRRRIIEAAKALNYRPNAAARELKYGNRVSEKQMILNVLVTRGSYDPFYSQMLRIIEIYALDQGAAVAHVWYHSSFSELLDSADLGRHLDEMLVRPDAADNGLIILGKCSDRGLEAIKKRFKYIVSINRNSTDLSVDEVICDGSRLATAAIEHLIGLGHRKIGFIGDTVHEARFEGYQKTLFRYNIGSDMRYVFSEGHGYERGQAAFEQWGKLPDPPTAIYCASDITALGVLDLRRKNQYYQPSVISSDNIDEAAFSSPMLTTVSIPKELMVRYALLLLRDRMNGGHKEKIKIELEGKLIVRESCTKVDHTMQIEYYI